MNDLVFIIISTTTVVILSLPLCVTLKLSEKFESISLWLITNLLFFLNILMTPAATKWSIEAINGKNNQLPLQQVENTSVLESPHQHQQGGDSSATNMTANHVFTTIPGTKAAQR